MFLKLGFIGFGGPAAHVAMMEDEVVGKRAWITREQFLDLLGATNLIPGPNSTEMAIHLGHVRAGMVGLVVSGTCFILPAMAVVLALAWAYVRFASLPAAAGLLYGVKPVVIAIVVQALVRLGRVVLTKRLLVVLTIVSVALVYARVHELAVLLVAGLCALAAHGVRTRRNDARAVIALLAPGLTTASGPVAAAALWPMFLFFLKVGSVLYGSGYVLLAFLRSDLVERWHWMTEAQLVDAIAIGQLTPGPLFTTATFIGYLLGGTTGALIATLGIFLPAFVFVAISGPIVPRIRRSPSAGAFLDGVNAASLALMITVTIDLGRSAIRDGPTVLLALVAGVLLARFRVNSAWLVLGGAAAGFALAMIS